MSIRERRVKYKHAFASGAQARGRLNVDGGASFTMAREAPPSGYLRAGGGGDGGPAAAARATQWALTLPHGVVVDLLLRLRAVGTRRPWSPRGAAREAAAAMAGAGAGAGPLGRLTALIGALGYARGACACAFAIAYANGGGIRDCIREWGCAQVRRRALRDGRARAAAAAAGARMAICISVCCVMHPNASRMADVTRCAASRRAGCRRARVEGGG